MGNLFNNLNISQSVKKLFSTRSRAILSVLVILVMILTGFSVLFEHNNNSPDVLSQTSVNSVTDYSTPSNTNHSVHAGHRPTYNSTISFLKDHNISSKDAYLPNFAAMGSQENGNVVTPPYTSSPSPMGIGDFGVRKTSGTLTGYNMTTPSIEGSVSASNMSAFYPGTDTPHSFSIQLNAILTNVTVHGNSSDAYWTQNVVFYSSQSHELTFIDNIWNFSSAYSSLPKSTFISGNGLSNPSFPQYYYTQGETVKVPYPFTLHLYLNSTKLNNEDSVFFNYSLSTQHSLMSGSYDKVVFNSTAGASTVFNTPTPNYLVSGTQEAPNGLPYDAEIILGGPGGGSLANFYGLNATMKLSYLKQARYNPVKSAFDTGGDTGETSVGVAVGWKGSTARVTTGPSMIYGMWNVTNSPMKWYKGQVAPSNSFMFINKGNTFQSTSTSWVPLPSSGKYSFELPENSYSVKVELSGHTPVETSLANLGSVTLGKSSSYGAYTPLYAMNNNQLAAISSSGSGSVSSQYKLITQNEKSISESFMKENDFGYSVFFGTLLYNVSDYATLGHYTIPWHIDVYGFNESLPMVFIQSSNLTIMDTNFTGQPYSLFGRSLSYPNMFGLTPLSVLNSNHMLIAQNTFITSYTDMYVYNSTNNVIWGNTFFSNYSYGSFTGINIDAAGNKIYNNYFWGFYNDVYSYYTGSGGSFVTNTWNIAKQSRSDTSTFNGYTFNGSIIKTSSEGGNYWWDYAGQSTPFNDYSNIPSNYYTLNPQGDNAPLVANYVHFTHSGLPSNLTYSFESGFRLNNTAIMNGNNDATVNLVNGTYSYKAPTVNTYEDSNLNISAEYIPSVKYGNVTVTSGGGSQTYVPIQYKGYFRTTFSESGLPSGKTWWVNLSDGKSFSTNSNTLVVFASNGSYSYTTSTGDKHYEPAGSGTFTVNGSQITNTVSFNPVEYQVDFEETGLTQGSVWSVDMGGSIHTTSSHFVNLTMFNGTYNATFTGPTGYEPNPQSIILTVDGSGHEALVQYQPLQNESYGNTVRTFSISNGKVSSGYVSTNYNYNISYAALDTHSHILFAYEIDSGNISAFNISTNSFAGNIDTSYNIILMHYSGSNNLLYATTQSGSIIVINPDTMQVTRTITPSPQGTAGNLVVSPGGTIYFLNETGTLFTISKSGKVTGSDTVKAMQNASVIALEYYSGQILTVNPQSNAIVSYNISTGKTSETYLPSGFEPYSMVETTVGNYVISSATSNDLTTYNASTQTIGVIKNLPGVALSGAYDPSNGYTYLSVYDTSSPYYSVDVMKANNVVDKLPGYGESYFMKYSGTTSSVYVSTSYESIVQLRPSNPNTITFTENGLPSGKVWYVNITGHQSSGPITSSVYTTKLSDGTFHYSMATSDKKYRASSGSFTVNGNTDLSVNFGKVLYDANITESGLPVNSQWEINNPSGSSVVGVGKTLMVRLDNGTHTILVDNLTNYYTTDYSLNLTIQGHNITAIADFKHYSYITGNVAPSTATVYVNGNIVSLSSGKFNDTVTNGSYNLKIQSPGYKTYYDNVSLSYNTTVNLSVHLKKINNSSPITSMEIDEIIAGIGGLGAILIILFILRRR